MRKTMPGASKLGAAVIFTLCRMKTGTFFFFEENVGSFFNAKCKTTFSISWLDPAILFLGIYFKEMRMLVHIEIYPQMLIATPSAMVKKLEKHTCPWVAEETTPIPDLTLFIGDTKQSVCAANWVDFRRIKLSGKVANDIHRILPVLWSSQTPITVCARA